MSSRFLSERFRACSASSRALISRCRISSFARYRTTTAAMSHMSRAMTVRLKRVAGTDTGVGVEIDVTVRSNVERRGEEVGVLRVSGPDRQKDRNEIERIDRVTRTELQTGDKDGQNSQYPQ